MGETRRKSWWGRNWAWFVPVGCLGSLLLFVGFISLILTLVFGMMKSSGAYKDAVAIAQSSPAVQEALGTPVETGLFTSGNIQISGSSGHADLSIPIRGPEGGATLFVVAEKSAGEWRFSTLVARIKRTGERVDLLPREEAPD